MSHLVTDTTVDRGGPAMLPALTQPSAEPSGAVRSARRAALVAGASLMAMSALAGFGNLVVMEGLVTPGDAAKTAEDVMGSAGLFRLGVAGLYLAAVLDVVIAWALMRVFSPVDEDLSRLAAWLRLAYAAVFLVAISQLAGIPQLLDAPAYATVFTPEQLHGQALLKVDTFRDVWFAGLILFGAHLALTGYLAWRSGFVPRVIAALLVVAGAGYAFDSCVAVFTEAAPFAVSNVTFLGEFLLGLWLLFGSRRMAPVGGQA
jgi:hypothetical protein